MRAPHYLVRCRDILAATQEAEALLTASRTEPVGRLSVTASVLFGRRHLAPILYEFLLTPSKDHAPRSCLWIAWSI